MLWKSLRAFAASIVYLSVAMAIIDWQPKTLLACNIPVFRYALERWNPDPAQVLVFYDSSLPDGSLGDRDETLVAGFEKTTILHGGVINAEMKRVDVSATMDDKAKRCFDAIKSATQLKLPCMAVQFSLGNNRTVTPWYGSVSEESFKRLRESPARSALASRFLAGHSVVWILLKSSNETKNRETKEMLGKELRQLEQKIKLPDGIGLPGSELYSEVPLLLKFSVLELDPADAAEELLVKFFRGFELTNVEEPLVIPVFGKGRALEVLPANQIDASLVSDLTLFLCGACSCQVKERNPGFDLWMNVDWNRELFGDNGDVPESVSTLARKPSTPKTLVIPPGKSKQK